MNTITFNRELKAVSDFIMKSEDGKKSWTTLESDVLDAPIFIWDDLEDDKLMSIPYYSDVLQKIESEPNILPFRFIRLYVRANATDTKLGMKGLKIWIQHKDEVMTIRAYMDGTVFRKDHMIHITTIRGRNSISNALRVGNEFLSTRVLTENPMLKNHFNAIMTSIAWFIREVSSPSNFVASVSPDKHGRTVEWIKARTHYVVINKAHPANRPDIALGDKVATTGDYIKRQAHSRRAHARVLRSQRFRHKVGHTIRVKACWVGPCEWKQFGSIYRMMKISSANT